MKTLAEKISERIESSKYKMLDTASSKMSNYFFLWNTENGKMPLVISEDDPAITKLRYSNHDAMCARSKANYEVVNEGFCYNGKFTNAVSLNMNIDCEDMTDEEIKEELYLMFDMIFDTFEIEEKGYYSVKLTTDNHEDFENLVAVILTNKL